MPQEIFVQFFHMENWENYDIINAESCVFAGNGGNMYNIGEKVVYSSHGVCIIGGIEERIVDRKPVSYYVLSPVDSAKTQFFVPTHNQTALAKMRHLLTRDDLKRMLSSPALREDCWIPEENRRKLRYKELTGSADFFAIAQMVHTLQKHRQAQLDAGRKFHMVDENFLRDAKRVLESELSVVLQVPPAQVVQSVADLLHE